MRRTGPISQIPSLKWRLLRIIEQSWTGHEKRASLTLYKNSALKMVLEPTGMLTAKAKNSRKTQVEMLLDLSSYAISLRPLSSLCNLQMGMGLPSEYVVKIKAHTYKVIDTGPGTELCMQYKKLREITVQ